jgi:DNA-nicking Smr family endonuclease
MRRPRSKRSLSAEERTLWAHVTRHVTPMPGVEALHPETADDQSAPAPASMTEAAVAPPSSTPAQSHRSSRSKTREHGRAKGLTPQARLDLHGMTQDEAHHALIQFITMSVALRCRHVLVITGKGKSPDPAAKAHPNEGRGILRRLVPLWLEVEPLRPLVAGISSAPVELGGPGALLVDLNPRTKSR